MESMKVDIKAAAADVNMQNVTANVKVKLKEKVTHSPEALTS